VRAARSLLPFEECTALGDACFEIAGFLPGIGAIDLAMAITSAGLSSGRFARVCT
jgi:hypothetical protein